MTITRELMMVGTDKVITALWTGIFSNNSVFRVSSIEIASLYERITQLSGLYHGQQQRDGHHA